MTSISYRAVFPLDKDKRNFELNFSANLVKCLFPLLIKFHQQMQVEKKIF